jgi:hypothetical protein
MGRCPFGIVAVYKLFRHTPTIGRSFVGPTGVSGPLGKTLEDVRRKYLGIFKDIRNICR